MGSEEHGPIAVSRRIGGWARVLRDVAGVAPTRLGWARCEPLSAQIAPTLAGYAARASAGTSTG
ncbi:MAG: hypothetical protein JWM12_2717, partial [Ilumatobacteraceae bacterium]|nr:hypothetical protein [Ilumatobacteraceae bacterium]